VWAPDGRDDTGEQPRPQEAGDAAWPGGGQGTATQAIQGWGGQSRSDWDSPPTWEQQSAQDAPPTWGQPTQGAPPSWGQPPSGWGQPPTGWGPPAAGRGSPKVPVAAAIAVALLVVIAVGAVALVRGVEAVRTVASPSTAAPFVPGSGSGGGGGAAAGGGGGTAGGGSSLGSGSVRLPERVDGLDRLELNEPGVLQGQEGMLDMVTRTGTIDGWGLGAYGRDADDPAFVLLVVKAREASTAGMISGAMSDSVRNRLGGDLSEPTPFTHGGVRYDCSKGQVGNLCSFQDGAMIGIGFGRGGDLGQLSRLTDDARRGVRS
jgi:hypothetical protein